MSRVEEIKAQIDALSWQERCELNALLQNWPDDEWDRQMATENMFYMKNIWGPVADEMLTGWLLMLMFTTRMLLVFATTTNSDDAVCTTRLDYKKG